MPQKNESGKPSEKQEDAKLEEKPKTEAKPEVKTEAKPEPAAPSEPVYSIERFLKDGEDLTGIKTYILAGALQGRTGDLTVAQAKSATDKFLNTEISEG